MGGVHGVVGTLAMLWRGLIPLSWLMASDAIMQFSVSVCDFMVDALSLSMLCLMSHRLHLFWFISLHSAEG